MEVITLLTSTYNRGNMLPKLYDSIVKQTVGSFKWLIIDDGSTDFTAKIVESWIKERLVKIEYIYQENGGKHTALNRAVQQIDTELTFIVDSDDYLPENAIETILQYHKKYKEVKGLCLCGYSFLRFYPDGKVNEAYFPKDELIDTYVNARINAGIAGDKAEVFFTDILKQYPFPVFPGEKFVPEDIVWVQMSGPYKMVHINQCVYISDYLEGGLTRSGKRMKLKSPKAMAKRAEIYLNDEDVNLKTKCKMILLYIIYGHAAKFENRELIRRIDKKGMYIIAFIPGIFIFFVWKIKYR